MGGRNPRSGNEYLRRQLAGEPTVPFPVQGRGGAWHTAPTDTEIHALRDEAIACRKSEEGVSVLLAIAFPIGSREMCGIRWPDVDMRSGDILVRNIRPHYRGGGFDLVTHHLDWLTRVALTEWRLHLEANAALSELRLSDEAYLLPNLNADAGGGPDGAVQLHPYRVVQMFKSLADRTDNRRNIGLNDVRKWHSAKLAPRGCS